MDDDFPLIYKLYYYGSVTLKLLLILELVWSTIIELVYV